MSEEGTSNSARPSHKMQQGVTYRAEPITFAVDSVTIPLAPTFVPHGEVQAILVLTFGPLTIVGARLVKMESGALQVWFPRLGRDNRIVMRGQGERDGIVAIALDAYRNATGRDLAETPLAKASPTKDSPS